MESKMKHQFNKNNQDKAKYENKDLKISHNNLRKW